MKLNRVRAKQFGCFKELDITLPTEKGFYLLTGRNEQNPSLGANACGKSTLLEIVTFCLFGKTSRNLKASKLLNRNASVNNYEVELEFIESGLPTPRANGSVLIKRTWNPNSLQLNGHELTQQDLEKQLRLTFDDFLLTTHFCQGGTHFFDYTAGAKLEFLSRVFGLDQWNAGADLCKQKHQQEKVNLTKSEQAIKNTQSNIELTKSNIAQVVVLTQKWAQEQLTRIEAAQGDIARAEVASQGWTQAQEQAKLEYQTHLDRLNQACAAWESQHTQALAELEQQLTERAKLLVEVDFTNQKQAQELVIKALEQSRADQDKQKQLIKDTEWALRDVDRQVKANQDKITSIQLTLGVECPSCSQEVPPEHINKISSKLLQENQNLHKEKQGYEEMLKERQGQLIQKQDSMQELESQYKQVLDWDADLRRQQTQNESVQRELQSLESQVRQKQKEVNPLLDQISSITYTPPQGGNPWEKQIETTRQRIRQLETESNPHETSLERINQTLLEQTQQLADHQEVHRNTESIISGLDYWKTHFPNIRLMILEEIIQELELHLNMALSKLGMQDYSVKLSTERELKSGEAKRELTLTTTRNQIEIDSDSLSGGERQRFRLASAIGISGLVKGRRGIDWNMTLLDEPSLGLSAEGIQDMLEYLKNLSEGQVVVLAEHRIADFGHFDGVWTAVKGQDGNSMLVGLDQRIPCGV